MCNFTKISTLLIKLITKIKPSTASLLIILEYRIFASFNALLKTIITNHVKK